ncbi:MAG: hypothetical protein ABL977_11300 [Candidatus Eisenbacteria bacterium]
MNMGPQEVSPSEVFAQIASAIPTELHDSIVIIGSLAAAHGLAGQRSGVGVRTKDVDCVLSPHITAIEHGRRITERLFASGWTVRAEGAFHRPGDVTTPADRLPAVRLYPPGKRAWFLELLSDPSSEHQVGRRWDRLALDSGQHFGLPSFEFTGITTHRPARSPEGLFYARPESMALANLLEHRSFSDQIIVGSEILGRPMLRRNKDLGRVLAIASLTPQAELEQWADQWHETITDRFPDRWRSLAATVGDGLRKLLASDTDLTEAQEHCNNGLLAFRPARFQELRSVGERVLSSAVEPIERSAG